MKQRKLLFLLPVAAIAVGIQNYLFFSSLGEGQTGIADEIEEIFEDLAPDPEAGLVAPDDLDAWLQAQAATARSPFLTRSEALALGEALQHALPRLSGTLVGESRRVAWLDRLPRVEGERIGRLEIARIAEHSVVLRDGDQTWEVVVAPAPASTLEAARGDDDALD